MKRYNIRLMRKSYCEMVILAKDRKEAIKNALCGDFETITEDQFILPSSEWDIVKVSEVQK